MAASLDTTMNIKNLFDDDSAVSPVIGVILMVAITVILAAVIGTFVLGLGSNVQSAPTTQFSVDYDSSNTATITHDGGDTIEASALSVTYQGQTTSGTVTDEWSVRGSVSEVTSGTSITTSENVQSGTELRVIWSAPSGDTTQTLATSSAP